MGKEATRRYRARIKQEEPEKYAEHLRKHREYAIQYRKDNPEKIKASNANHRYYAYGITSEELAELFVQQHSACAICGKQLDITQTRKWCVDHCHETGRVRGILCFPCNVALGQFSDSPAMLMRAIQYLEGTLHGEGNNCQI